MKLEVYRNILSEEQVINLKASEIRDFREHEIAIGWIGILYLISAFSLFISLSAMILWFSEITIFIFLITLAPYAFFYLLRFKTVKQYKSRLNEVRKRDL